MSSVSIVIPTYNEAEFLPHLLTSIYKQSKLPLEIIVADANSTDDTRQIAQKMDCRVVDGGLPAVGRNRGAKVAKGDLILFLDADVTLPTDCLEKCLQEFDKRYLEIAVIKFKAISNLHLDHLLFRINELAQENLQEFYPITPGASLLVTKRLHNRLGGFNETLKTAEDNDYGDRARKLAKFGVITDTHVNLSVRRFEKEGRFRLLNKYMTKRFFKSLKRLGVEREVDYDFGHYGEPGELSRAEEFLEKVLRQMESKKDS